MTEIHYCENCKEHEAEVTMTGPGGETQYLCRSPECMMAAGICPNCQVDLDVVVKDTGESIYHCPKCDYEKSYHDLGQA